MPSSAPWVGIAHGDAREWFRDHPRAPLEEYDEWVCRVYEPQVLRGNGYAGGRFGVRLNEILDQVHVGMRQALDDERRRRGVRREDWVA